MNDAKSLLMMYSYAAMKAVAEEEKAEEHTEEKVTKRRGKKNDKGRERENRTIVKE